jgi:hypothetical protein
MPQMSRDDWVQLMAKAGLDIALTPPADDGWVTRTDHINQHFIAKVRRRPGKYGEVIAHAGRQGKFDGMLPPWGHMDDSLMAEFPPPIPFDWLPPVTQWPDWLAEIVAAINTLLWPKYVRGSAGWPAPPLDKLFDADFLLLAALRERLNDPICGVMPTTVQHADYFAEEDDRNIRFGTRYDRYDPTLPRQALDCLSDILTAGVVDKVGCLDLQLKWVFQRPRPYQVALLHNRTGFTHEAAASAGSPSLVSGHCLQGSMAGCAAFAALKASLGNPCIEVLKQFTMDIGDRRVFAGVHYPSDNLASWYAALMLIPCVFDSAIATDVNRFLGDAIRSKSIVFRAIEVYKDKDGNSPYSGMVDAIKCLT